MRINLLNGRESEGPRYGGIKPPRSSALAKAEVAFSQPLCMSFIYTERLK